MKIIRRIILFLAIILSVLWIEAAHADMSAPEMREFEVVVTNPDGIDYYDYNGTVVGHLNKGETVIVAYQYNDKYRLASKEKNKFGNYETFGNVTSLDGFSIVQEEVDPTKTTEGITKLEKTAKARVYADEGVDVYKGPSDVYEKVGHIKKDVILSYDYEVQSTAGGIVNIYVEYNGIKGWVEILKGKVLIQNDAQYIFSDDISTECGVIPKNSIATPKYVTDSWTHKSLFEYNGCEFMYETFRDDKVFYIYQYNQKTLVDLPLYEYADTTSTQLGTAPAGSLITVLASKDTMGDPEYVMYVKYNDITGWAVGSGDVFDYNNYTPNDDDPVKIDDTIKVEEEDISSEVSIPNAKMGLNTLILLCSFGVGLLVVTALVTIILVNKNKAAKNEETKVEKTKEK